MAAPVDVEHGGVAAKDVDSQSTSDHPDTSSSSTTSSRAPSVRPSGRTSRSNSIRHQRPRTPSPVRSATQQMYRSTSHASGPDAIEPPSSRPRRDLKQTAEATPSERGVGKQGDEEEGGNGRDEYYETGDEIYDKYSKNRKAVIVAVMSLCAFLSPISSTSILSATPEVSKTYHTSGSVINASNAGYMVFMALAPIVWGPFSQVFGRRIITLISAVVFLALSVATALAPDFASFFVFRALSAFEGTAFLLVGSATISDIYRPTERGTAVAWFMSGTLIGPALGPFIGGVIVTYVSWRSIFWLQTALAGVAVVCVFFFVPETIHRKGSEDLKGMERGEKLRAILKKINPINAFKWFRFWNLVLVTYASASLVWNMYSILTPIRYVLNPRFHLESPLLGGLFYLAPGVGYLVGTFGGGRWADRTVKRWIRKRNGVRVAEDRLRATIPFVGVFMPACILIYGWTVDQAVGGIPVPVIVLFAQGVLQLFCFPALNTYCLDMAPGHGAAVAAANFCVRYLSGAVGTGVVLPAVQSMGVGWFSTISAFFMISAGFVLVLTVAKGKEWREATEEKIRLKAERKQAMRDGTEEADPGTSVQVSGEKKAEEEAPRDDVASRQEGEKV